jgi:hypothetical protein
MRDMRIDEPLASRGTSQSDERRDAQCAWRPSLLPILVAIGITSFTTVSER